MLQWNMPIPRLEPNMLKNLPIIPSKLLKTFTHYFLFYCVNNNIIVQEWLYEIYIVLIALIEYFDCCIRVSPSFANYIGGRAQQAFGRAWALPGMLLATPLFETNISCISYVSAILASDYSYFMHAHSP